MDIKNRLDNFRKEIDFSKIQAVFISNSPNIVYLTGYTGFSEGEREAFLLVAKNGQYLITDGRYTEAVTKKVPSFTVLERSAENPLKTIFEKLVKKHKIETVGIEEFDLKVAEFKSLKKMFKKMTDFNSHSIRSQKDKSEVEKIEAACDLADKALKQALAKITTGVSEKDVALEFEMYLKKNYANTSFSTIVGFGPNSSVPHHETDDTKLSKKPGQFVLIDCGAKLDNYCSDMTRTYFFGQPSKEQEKIYNTVLEAQTKAAELIDQKIKSGQKIWAKEPDELARKIIEDNGYKSYSHSLGHGTGLEIHEPPTLSIRSTQELTEGMVFSIEPGIYIPDFGGVRIEDLYVIEKKGLRQLTKSPKKLTII
jgi:Xaa-Pro aminopeptidase